MAKIGQEALDYEPQQTKNIADLDVVGVDAEIVEKTYKDTDNNSFTLKVIIVDGEDYRVPVSVLKALKTILEDKPSIKHFKVKKTGEGLKTEYVVIPLE